MYKAKLFSRKAIEWSVVFGLLCAVFMSFSHFNAACDDLRTNVLRLHIIANSDSAEDQALKLKIRDRVLAETTDVFDSNTDLDEAIESVEMSLPEFEKIANEVIKENGFEYSAKASVGDSYFETRVYDDFTLPAGTYKSLIIRLGKAEGKNWWCVVFPTVCIPAAAKTDVEADTEKDIETEKKAELSDTTAEESASIAEHPQKYEMKFKTVEIYEDIKNYFKS